MAFAKFNQCNPCCNCSFEVSYTAGGGPIPGITITARDVNGSGVGSCVTTVSGCSIPIKHPGTYYIHNDYCNTTQKVVIAKCGNDVNVVIPCASLNVEAHSECFFDVPLTQFDFSGPSSYSAQASGNTLIGSLPFPQLAAQVTMPCPRPSGTYTVTVSDVEGNHYPKTIEVDLYCSQPNPRPSIYLLKKWGYAVAPNMISINGCPGPGVTVSDSDGHSAVTDSDGHICEMWKYDFPDRDRVFGDNTTFITVTKAPFISPCGDTDACERTRGLCNPEPADCRFSSGPPFSPYVNLTNPPGYWSAPMDECVEEQPETLTLTTNGFSLHFQMCRHVYNEEGEWIGIEPVPDSSFTTNTVVMSKNSPFVSFPYTYAYPVSAGITPGSTTGELDPNPWVCGAGSVSAAVSPGCRKDVNSSFPYGIVSIGNGAITPFGPNFPGIGFNMYSQSVGTSACPTMFTVTEYSSITGEPTGRSVTVSNS